MFQEIATEMVKLQKALALEILKYIFVELNENCHNLRNQSDFRQSLKRTAYHGRESISLVVVGSSPVAAI